MRVLNIGGLPTSLGEIIIIKYHLDQIKNQYDQIKLSFHTQLWKDGLHTDAPDWPEKKILWDNYLRGLGQLFFSEPPYILEPVSKFFGGDGQTIIRKHRLQPKKTEMADLLCKGTSLNLDEDYVVITTKIRYLKKTDFYPRATEFWKTIKKLSSKYKIVILGEREVEMRREYLSSQDSIYGIYEQIISNISNDRILDLTLPALGETVSDLKQIQQDCLIMNEAKLVITLGVGGNSCMSTAVAKMAVGYRNDNLWLSDAIFSREYPNAIITKDWPYFLQVLERYL
jgi:hypothetical protein